MAIDLENLLKLMVQTGISDIHFKAEARPVLRLHGKIISSGNMKVLSREEVSELAMALMNEEQRKIFEQEKELDLAYSLQNLSRFRANVFMQRGSVAVTLRVVPLKVKNFEELNLPKEVLQKLAQEPRGLILFAGITGAGKTTTMNSFLQFLNENRSCRIITIEDPIEYYHQDTKASIVQREVGLDTASFGKALKNVLRQDPDVVVVGEMRDLETVQAAITAAETGHLVLSTIHTMDAGQTIDRVIDVHPSQQHPQVRQQLANVLKGVVAQRLVPAKGGAGRFPATEVLVMQGGIRRAILEGKTAEIHKMMEGGEYYGMRTFDQDLIRLFQEGKIDQKEALENASNPEDLSVKLKGVRS